ncbi:MAG: hypothetical protein MSG78_04050 [Clostridiales bacterium]|nr:hypothetical protein [Clostridiales bacterium]
MKRTNLDGINRIRFNDFTEYETGKSNNGGCYGFWTDYNRLENGIFEVSHGTTADFEYCPVCGDFHSYDEETCGEYQTVTEPELLKLINDFEETEDEYIEYK